MFPCVAGLFVMPNLLHIYSFVASVYVWVVATSPLSVGSETVLVTILSLIQSCHESIMSWLLGVVFVLNPL